MMREEKQVHSITQKKLFDSQHENENFRRLMAEENELQGGWCMICINTRSQGFCCGTCNRFFCDLCVNRIQPSLQCSFCMTTDAVTIRVRFD